MVHKMIVNVTIVPAYKIGHGGAPFRRIRRIPEHVLRLVPTPEKPESDMVGGPFHRIDTATVGIESVPVRVDTAIFWFRTAIVSKASFIIK